MSSALTMKDIITRATRFKIGDKVFIPPEILNGNDEDGNGLITDGQEGIVCNISTYTITVSMDMGYKRTVSKVDAEKLIMVKPSDFAVYNEEMMDNDFLDAISTSLLDHK